MAMDLALDALARELNASQAIRMHLPDLEDEALTETRVPPVGHWSPQICLTH